MRPDLKRFELFLWIALAIASTFLWYFFSMPRYQAIDLSIDQKKALSIAREYIVKNKLVDLTGYQSAAVFGLDDGADRYLQKTLGTEQAAKFLDEVGYELFYWSVRFFKENERREIKVVISSRTGEVFRFGDDLEATAARPLVDKETSRQYAVDFLKRKFAFDPSRYAPRDEDLRKLDNRTEYTFSWERKGVDVPWDKAKGGGSAKLLTSVVVSGTDILAFNKGRFDIPEGFDRYVDNLKQTGQNLTMVFRMIYLALLTLAIMLIVNRKHHFVPRVVKRFYVGVGLALFLFMCIETVNGQQYFFYNYPTSQSFADYLLRAFMQSIVTSFFLVLAFVLPGLTGEALRFENSPASKARGFLSAILSSFFTRPMAQDLCMGYVVAAIVLGAQSVIFHVGYTYWGVWDELSWLTQASTTLVPAFTAVLIGFHASFSEEIMFRLFAINLVKRYGGGTVLAVILSAVMWGFGHTGYEIFPMWFRGVEVTLLGIILAIAYLRFGLVTVIAAHFLMDAFLTVLPYVLKPQSSFNLYSSLFVIALPLLLATIAFIMNRPTEERPMSVRFNPQQKFNAGILEELRRGKGPEQLAVLKKDLLHHGWDPAIVEQAFNSAII